jgi:predicted HicB family RNase H-like nuclease
VPDVSINYRVPSDIHRRAKLNAVAAGITLHQYVIEALQTANEAAEGGPRARKPKAK